VTKTFPNLTSVNLKLRLLMVSTTQTSLEKFGLFLLIQMGFLTIRAIIQIF